MTLVYTEDRGASINRTGAKLGATIKGEGAAQGETLVDARALAEASVPPAVDGYSLKDVTVDEEAGTAKPVFRVTADYGLPPGVGAATLEVAEERERWHTAAENRRVYHSLQTISKVPPEAPDYDKQIAVNDEGKPDGVDVPTPRPSFSVETRRSAQSTTESYKRAIALMVGTVNAAPFRGFQTGELRLSSAELSERDDGTWDATFTFEISPNETNVPVGGLTIAAKEGWDLAWAKAVPDPDPTTGEVRSKVQAAYVERVSPRSNFAVLGISP
ncbi:MAG: hypothetical protein KC466_21725 [Myxococcales bacterium]|nr:hypothetical protein [Myxococcales bacterium]